MRDRSVKISGKWVSDKRTLEVFAALENAGYRAWFVGGCVRNALLGEPVGDIDIATTALPDQVMRSCRDSGLRVVATGVEHGTVTVISDGLPHEVTTLRRDVETYGRRAVVSFSEDIVDDARRRDFTINALYACADGTVVDPLNGMPDLRLRRIRFIEDAARRIEEDHLRSLRFFRFHAWYGDQEAGMDSEALAAIAVHLDGLAILSAERVGAEMLKLLSAPDPAPAVAAMDRVGVLARILPGADSKGLAPLVHLEGNRAPDPVRRLAVLGGEDPVERLRLSRKQGKSLSILHEIAAETQGAAALGYRFGASLAVDGLLVRSAVLGCPLEAGAAENAEFGAAQVFPVQASDLMPDLSGVALGKALRDLEQDWLASGFRKTKADLLAR